jgi:hypothetical protein
MTDRVEGQPRLTLDDIRAMDCPTLTPNQAGGVLGIDPNNIRWQAHENPEALGFPVIVCKRRTHIPRIPFIEFLTGGKT